VPRERERERERKKKEEEKREKKLVKLLLRLVHFFFFKIQFVCRLIGRSKKKKKNTMSLPDAAVALLAPHAAHSVPGMSSLAYVASSSGEEEKALSLLTCGADGALSSRKIDDANAAAAAAALSDSTSVSTGASPTPLTCLAASRGVFAVGDESNYVRVRE